MPAFSLLEWAGLVGAALVTAVMSAVAGVGGGAALVGVMAALLPSAAIVPVHGVVQLASNSARVVAFRTKIHWGLYARIAPSLVVGALLARELLARVFQGEGISFLRVVVGGFLLFFLVWRRLKPEIRTPPLWIYIPLGVLTGGIGIFVGAQGPFIAPFLLRDDLEKEEVIATSAVCMATGHLLKIPVFLSLGFPFENWLVLILACTGAVIAGTFIGKYLLTKLNPKHFVPLVELLLFVLGVWLCASWTWREFGG